MYLLGLRALGHDVFYIEDTGECVYDPVQNTRSHGSVLTAPLHPQRARAVRPRRPLGVRQLRRHLSRPQRRRGPRFCADADLFLNLSGGSWFWRDEYARIPRKAFIDSDPAFTQLAIAKAEPWYVEFFQRFDRLFTFGANIGTPPRRFRSAISRGTRPGSRSRSTSGARRSRPRDRFTSVMTWQIESFTDVGGNKDQEFVQIHRPAVADGAAASSWRSTGRSACCASTAGTRSTRWASRARCGTTGRSSSESRANSASPSTPTSRPARDGSAIAPSVISPPGGRRSCRTPAGPRTCRTARVCSPFSTPDEALAGIDTHQQRLRAPRPARREIAREHFDARRVLPRLLE